MGGPIISVMVSSSIIVGKFGSHMQLMYTWLKCYFLNTFHKLLWINQAVYLTFLNIRENSFSSKTCYNTIASQTCRVHSVQILCKHVWLKTLRSIYDHNSNLQLSLKQGQTLKFIFTLSWQFSPKSALP